MYDVALASTKNFDGFDIFHLFPPSVQRSSVYCKETIQLAYFHRPLHFPFSNFINSMDGDQSAKTFEQGANSAVKDNEMTSGIHESVKQTVSRYESQPFHASNDGLMLCEM